MSIIYFLCTLVHCFFWPFLYFIPTLFAYLYEADFLLSKKGGEFDVQEKKIVFLIKKAKK